MYRLTHTVTRDMDPTFYEHSLVAIGTKMQCFRAVLSRRYCLLNGGAFGWAFMLMRNYKGANHA